MAGMEAILFQSDSDDSDNDDSPLEEITAGSAVAATVQPIQAPPPAAAPVTTLPQPPAVRQPSSSSSMDPLPVSQTTHQHHQRQQAPTATVPPAAAPRPANTAQPTDMTARLKSLYSPAAPKLSTPVPAPAVAMPTTHQGHNTGYTGGPPSTTHYTQHQQPSTAPSIPHQHQQQQQQQLPAAPSTSQIHQQATAPSMVPNPVSASAATMPISSSSHRPGSQIPSSASTHQPQQQQIDQAKRQKDEILTFIRILMDHLKKTDIQLYRKGEATIRDCVDRNKKREKYYESVTNSMKRRLKELVPDLYWNHALQIYKERHIQKKRAAALAAATQAKAKEQQLQKHYQPPPSQAQPHALAKMTPVGSTTGPTVRTTTTATTTTKTTPTAATTSDSSNNEKKKFFVFLRFLMKYLEQNDSGSHAAAKKIVQQCVEANKQRIPGYESATASMERKLRELLGEEYWKRIQASLRNYFAQHHAAKQKKEAQAKQAQAQAQAQAAVATAATKKKEAAKSAAVVASAKKQKQKETDVGNRAASAKQKNTGKQEKEKTTKGSKQDGTAAKPGTIPAATKKKASPRKTSPKTTPGSSGVIAGTSAASSQAGSSKRSNKSTQVVEKPPSLPPKEYNELMDMVENAATYDWTTAASLLGKQHLSVVNLSVEQKKLLYGEEKDKAEDAMPQDKTMVEPLSHVQRGWDRRNVLSARAAWARVRLNETDHIENGTPKASWFNEDRAEEDTTLALLSEATEIYLKSVLEKAVQCAHQRQNLDGLRLWHLQHDRSKPAPLSLRLGCDVRRQVARAAGNAAKTYKRMEAAIERQEGLVPPHARALDDHKVLFEAESMADLAMRPKLANAKERAEANSKRSFDVFNGKDSSAPPFGRVKKRAKLLVGDFRSAFEQCSFYQQRKNVAALAFL